MVLARNLGTSQSPSSLYFYNKRPVFDTDVYYQINSDDLDEWLLSRKYYGGPYVVDAVGTLQASWREPLVAQASMCTEPVSDGGYDNPSPNAKVIDRFSPYTVTSAGSLDLSPTTVTTGVLSVQAIPIDLPAGFALNFNNGQAVQLTTAASAGATSLNVAMMDWDVHITNGMTGRVYNWFMS